MFDKPCSLIFGSGEYFYENFEKEILCLMQFQSKFQI
jgi:hypothetical protein